MTTLRFGRVTEREAATARVRVVFEDTDDLESPWLAVGHAKTLGDRVLWMPDEGAHVACLLEEHGDVGLVLCHIYSEADLPPVSSLDRLHLAMADGATLDYDRTVHRLSIAIPPGGAALQVEVNGDVTISVPDGRNVHVGGDAGKQLATVEFVTQVHLKHTHPTPAGVSGPPIPLGIETVWPQVTTKGRSE
ncbi:MAG TPA: hypothetical protein VGB92_25855 [Longimicrobium sp.]|jgi:phage baseplate assembly protein V